MEFLQEWGYIGLFIGTFLAATIIPFSSELLVTGILIAGGNLLPAFIVSTAGNWLGGLSSYYLGYLGKWEWIEKWLHISREKLERQRHRIKRYGAMIALCCWLPFVGDIFALGLGFYRLDFTKCAIYMLIGKAARFGLWIACYSYLGERLVLHPFFPFC